MYESFDDDEPQRSRFLPGFALGVGAALLLVGTLGAAWAAHAHAGGWRSHGHDWSFGAEVSHREAPPAREIAAADAASQRLVTTLIDVAEVLPPEQRAELLRALAGLQRRD